MERKDQEQHEAISSLQRELRKYQDETHDLTEQLNLYKGRCANLQRDVQLGSSTMERLNSDQGSMAGQIAHYKSRIQELEDKLA